MARISAGITEISKSSAACDGNRSTQELGTIHTTSAIGEDSSSSSAMNVIDYESSAAKIEGSSSLKHHKPPKGMPNHFGQINVVQSLNTLFSIAFANRDEVPQHDFIGQPIDFPRVGRRPKCGSA